MSLFSLRVLVLLMIVPACRLWSAEGNAPGAPTFVLPEIGESPAPARFSEAEMAFVTAWIRREAPECPEAAMTAAAENFLDELRRRYPDESHNLLSAGFPVNRFASALLRHVGAAATGGANAALREKLAVRRIAALAAEGQPGFEVREAGVLLEKVRESSAVQHRRVLEGRLDDDELRSLLEKTLRPAGEQKPAAAPKPVELSAADLVSEYARRNQTGAAVSRLQAYTIEGRLTGSKGEATDLLLFKMRPDRFRLVLRRNGRTLTILAGDGGQYWLQIPGRPHQVVSAKDIGERRFLGEFMDPLLGGEGFGFERLPDGEKAGRKFYRLAVRRADGSGHVARLDTETLLEIGRENQDGAVIQYSDHREVAGIILAFREEITDDQGGTSTLVVTRMTANPGLIADFFRPPPAGQPSYADFEQFVSTIPSTTASNP